MVLPARVNAIALPPLAAPAAVLNHLLRCTHRTPIGNDGVVAIDGVEFIGRFLRHVLPLGFERIRHCGILAAAHKARALAAARAALAMPAA